MPAVPPLLAETISQLRHILSCDGIQILVILSIAVTLVCCVLLLYTRRAVSRAANEDDPLEYSTKRDGRNMEFGWPAPGQPTPAAELMYVSAMGEDPGIGGREYDAAELYPAEILPFRRTSYTKQIGDVNVQEEIMIREGWIRHTRVYGGGVCLACEDSKKKQKMMVMKLQAG